MKIDRHYTTPNHPVTEQVTWARFDVLITNEDGSVNFEQRGVEAPAGWSQNAVNILASKYFRKAGVPLGALDGHEEINVPSWLWPRQADPGIPLGGETSARQVFHRLAGCWTYWGWCEGLFSTEDDARVFYDEMFAMLALQIAAPNSPQWFNTGLHWAYGISGEGGQWVIDGADAQPVETPDAYARPQVHACFINRIEDNLVGEAGIYDLLTREARIFKYGSGAGSNFSKLRGKNERLSGGGVASGLISFLEVLDRGAGAIQSGGTTRRAAKMIVVDADHPEIEDFIAWKPREEVKAAAMAVGSRVLAARAPGTPQAMLDRAGIGMEPAVYDLGWECEPVRTVSGQNANNTVRLSDKFMARAAKDDDWELRARTTGAVVKTINANDLWLQICQAAWACADPGLHFADTINAWHTCPKDGEILSSNPCSEYFFLDETACFAGDTCVWTMEGPQRFDELARAGKDVRVLTELPDGSLAYRNMISPRRTRKNAKVVEITLKSRGARGRKNTYSKVRATPDHRFYLRRGSEKRVDELQIGDSLESAYSYSNEKVYNSHELVRDYVLLAEYKHGRRPVSGEHVHHSDKDHGNRALDNIEIKNGRTHVGEHNSEWFATASAEKQRVRGEKISLARRGVKLSDAHKLALSNAHKGKKQNPEAIKKRAQSNTGKKRSAATIERMQQAWDRRRLEGRATPCASKVWITNGRDNRRVDDPTKLPSGWRVGRVIKHFDEQLPVNHTVENIEWLEESCDVYCGTVPSTGRFFITVGTGREGVLVHNCNLASLRLTAFQDANNNTHLALDAFEHAARLWTIVLDISVSMASYPAAEIARGSYNYRTLGLGYCDLGGLLVQLDLRYNSDEGRALAAGLTALLTGVAYRTSAELAAAVGPFPRWDTNADDMRRVLRNHAKAVHHTLVDSYVGLNVYPAMESDFWRHAPGALASRAREVWQEVVEAKIFRNAQVSLLAPTGTISLVMTPAGHQVTSGVEPYFSPLTVKSLAGGGEMSFAAANVWDEDCAVSARPLPAMAHVRMVAAVQPYLSGAVSKTINLPNDATVADVCHVYAEAHRLGLKAVALYRDGSKLNQPLATGAVATSAATQSAPEVIQLERGGERALPRGVREYLPWRRDLGFRQKVKIDGQTIFISFSEYPDGRPGEMFLDLAHEGSTLRGMANCLAMAVSLGLQSGVPAAKFAELFRGARFEPAGVIEGHDRIKLASSIPDYIGRELAITYCDDEDAGQVVPAVAFDTGQAAVALDRRAVRLAGQYTGDVCPHCHNATMEPAGKCLRCVTCGETSGCG
jgi:ribonucleotide reductase alpha subunit